MRDETGADLDRDAAAELKEDEGEKAVDILEDTGIPVTVDEED